VDFRQIPHIHFLFRHQPHRLHLPKYLFSLLRRHQNERQKRQQTGASVHVFVRYAPFVLHSCAEFVLSLSSLKPFVFVALRPLCALFQKEMVKQETKSRGHKTDRTSLAFLFQLGFAGCCLFFPTLLSSNLLLATTL
jgi:hypothetical protein